METRLDDRLPILEVVRNCIVSKMGDLTIGLEITKPEIFTLSSDNYEALHQTFVKALKVLPVGSVFHMQDIFVKDSYEANYERAGESFLARASERFFNERALLRHTSYIYLTKKPAGRKPASSAASGLLRRNLVPADTLSSQVIREFEDGAGQFARILSDSGLVQVRRLETGELVSGPKKAGLIEQYCYLNPNSETLMIRDISLEDPIRIGERECLLFTLSEPEHLPAMVGSRINYDRYSTDRTKFSVGFAAPLGQLLYCNHIYNQYIFLDDGPATIKKLEAKRLRLQSLANYSRENAIGHAAVNDFLNEAISEQRSPVRAHFNVLAWSAEKEELKDIRNRVTASLAQLDAGVKQETVGAPQIWSAGIPGNAADFPMNETFDTFAEQAVCFFNLETSYQDSPSTFGIRLGDRLTGKPVLVDLFDEPMKQGVTTNRNCFVCGSPGGGKSMMVNHILRTLFEVGAHIVIVDIGGSYKGLCELVGGRYFTHTPEQPISVNMHLFLKDPVLDVEQLEALKSLYISLWKKNAEDFERSEYIALSNAIRGFHGYVQENPGVFPCHDTFFEYLMGPYEKILQAGNVRDKEFDLENFLYILRPFYKDGEFDYLLNAQESVDLMAYSFIVFELDTIRDHPILFPVITQTIMSLFISKLRHVRGQYKVLAIDEAWQAIAKQGMAGFIRYAYKTIRKFDGIPIMITQEIDDLISSSIIKGAIIDNSDIKLLMDMRKFMNKFDALQDTLGLSDKAKTILLSVNRHNEPGRSYREVYIDLGGAQCKVYRNELSLEEYLAYTTEQREKLKVMAYAQKYGSIRKGIEVLAAEMRAGDKHA